MLCVYYVVFVATYYISTAPAVHSQTSEMLPKRNNNDDVSKFSPYVLTLLNTKSKNQNQKKTIRITIDKVKVGCDIKSKVYVHVH